MHERRPARFAVICTGTTLPAWQAECLRQVLAVPGTELALLIRDIGPADHPGRRWWPDPSLPHVRLLWRLYSSLYLARRLRATMPVDLAAAFADVPVLRWKHTQARAFSEGDLALVRDHGLDFILHLAGGTPHGAILDAARHGVWTLYHGNQGRDRLNPPCYWEVYRHADTVRAALVRIGDDAARDVVLRQGTFKVLGYSYARTCDQVQTGAAHWPAQVCRDIQAGATSYLASATPAIIAPCSIPTNTQVARLLVLLVGRFLLAAIHKLSWSEEWNIGIIDAPIHTFLLPGARPSVRWLPEPASGTFLADPFGIETQIGDVILVEQFEQRTGRGHIAVLESRESTTFSLPRPVIRTPYHLSYPALVQHDGTIYCIPESGATGEVVLYKAVAFPYRWVQQATLISGFAAKDATVLRHDGRWWLLCSEARHAQNNTLYAWHASDLFGPWLAHPANPLKIDIRSSRPAGAPFVHDGYLYRPAQDCSRTYGGAVTINRVSRLTPTAFEEQPVVTVEPYAQGPYPLGIHTISAFGQRTVIDGKRERRDWQGLRVMLRRVLLVMLRRVLLVMRTGGSPFLHRCDTDRLPGRNRPAVEWGGKKRQ